jgi:hypothetical protein
VPETANDNVSSGDLAGIANPTISEVLAAYLAEEKARLKPDTYGLYADVIELLQASLDGYAHASLEEHERAFWERHFNADGDQHREFCEIFGPEHILPNVGEFLDYFMVRKVMADQALLRASGTVTKKLAVWLGAKGYAGAVEAAAAIERGTVAARDLPKADKLTALLYELTSGRYVPGDNDIEDQFGVERVEPGKIWLEIFDSGRQVVPISLPEEATQLCRAGWTISGAVRRIGEKWVLVEAWNVYP